MSMLAFFPWLELKDPVTFAEFELIPFVRGSAPGGAIQESVDRVLADVPSTRQRY